MYGISQFYWAGEVTLSPVVVKPFTNTSGKNLSFYFSNRVQYSNDSLDCGIPGTYSVPQNSTSPSKAAKVQQNLSYPTPVESVFLCCHMLFFHSHLTVFLCFCTKYYLKPDDFGTKFLSPAYRKTQVSLYIDATEYHSDLTPYPILWLPLL